MSSTDTAAIVIAGKGHVYRGQVGTAWPDLWAYTFGNGTTLRDAGWEWLGDTSAENTIEFGTEGGETTTKDTWDRPSVKSTKSSTSNTVTINSVSMDDTTIQTAFPGSTYVEATDGYDLVIGGTSEVALLVVVEDGDEVSGYGFRRVTIGGAMPTISREEFTEIALTGTLLAPPSGETAVHFFKPRKATGKSIGRPTITRLEPSSAAVGASVTITGTNFGGTRTVTVNGVKARFDFVSAATLRILVPAGATTGNVVVTNGSGASEGSSLTVA